MIAFSSYAHLANECLQPLGHVSAPGDSQKPNRETLYA
jgi:hypothetical protein